MLTFTCDTKTLIDVMALAKLAVVSNSTIPVLKNVLIESIDEGVLRIMSTDLDIGIRQTMPAMMATVGAACVPWKALADAVKGLNRKAPVTVSADGMECKVSQGAVSLTVMAMEPQSYPDLPCLDAIHYRRVAMDASLFRQCCRAVAPAILAEESRSPQNGAVMDLDACALVAADGHRLHLARYGADSGETPTPFQNRPLIHHKVLAAITKTKGVSVTITMDDLGDGGSPLYLSFVFSDYRGVGVEIIARQVSGSFPDWRRCCPREDQRFSVVVNRAELLTACRSIRPAVVVANARAMYSVLALDPGRLQMLGGDAAEGPTTFEQATAQPMRACAVLAVDTPAAGMFRANLDYWIDALEASEENTVTLRFAAGEQMGQCVGEVIAGNVYALVMPMWRYNR